ncbi:MAG: VanZ family protein [Betaproteobacteria bacterium]|nr:VanZ family protein [Betaproteobacteria bacterium]MBI2959391.1 VanZ family protein [Betaproteobacteria bacterium]
MQPSPLARWLLLAYALLIVDGSLYPFSGWRDQGVAPLAFLWASLPRYVTTFDVATNVLAYAPLGFLATLAMAPSLRGGVAVALAALAGAALSLGLEAIQTFLPSRIASNLDFIANAAGGLLGALAGAAFVERLIRRRGAGLQDLRRRMFSAGGRIDLGLVLLGLWLVSQLNPETLLFGNGDLRVLLAGPSGVHYPPDLFIRAEAAVAGANAVALGLFASCLVERGQPARLAIAALIAAALALRTLAFGMLFHPLDMLLWATPGALFGAAAGTLVALVLAALPRPARLALAGLVLMAATVLVNIAPENPYLAASLAVWRQGHFLNFNGLTRFVSWIWPFAALAYLMLLAAGRTRSRV